VRKEPEHAASMREVAEISTSLELAAEARSTVSPSRAWPESAIVQRLRPRYAIAHAVQRECGKEGWPFGSCVQIVTFFLASRRFFI
jgi:hypothetical protein